MSVLKKRAEQINNIPVNLKVSIVVLAGLIMVLFGVSRSSLQQLVAEPLSASRQILLAFVGAGVLIKGVFELPQVKLNAHNVLIRWPARNWLMLLGSINMFAYFGYAVLTYGLTPASGDQPNEAGFFGELAESFGFLGSWIQSFLTGQTFAAPQNFILGYTLPLFVLIITFVMVLAVLAAHHDHLSPAIPRQLYIWSMSFALACALAAPLLVHDFWFDVARGRMVATGVNPYYQSITPEFAENIPLDYEVVDNRMPYGPLWTAFVGLVMGVTGGHWLWGAVLFKVLMAATWLGSLRLIWLMLADQSEWMQAVGIVTFGWMPLSVMQAVGDGHNGNFMIFFLLLWLYALKCGKAQWRLIALMASTLFKYVVAPFFALDFLYFVRSEKSSFGRYVIRAGIAGLFAMAVFALFFRSPAFFDGLFANEGWRFHTPRDAVWALEFLTGITFLSWVTSKLVRLLFIGIGLYYIWKYWQTPVTTNFWRAALGILAIVVFSILPHIWPWYLMWVIALAALVPDSYLARWATGLALTAPFPIIIWIIFPDINQFLIFHFPVLVHYIFAIYWLLAIPSGWFPSPRQERPNPVS